MNIYMMGKPGSGKGSIIEELKKEGFVHISTGDLLRLEEESGSELGKEIKQLLSKGMFASDAMIFNIIENVIEKNQGKNIIFDGFPRTIAQAQYCLDNPENFSFDKVFLIDVSDEVVKERIVNRRVHLESGRIYNLKTKPPKVAGLDDVTGEPLFHRHDDKLEVLDKRLENFRKLTAPIVDLLMLNKIEVNLIDGTSPLAEQKETVYDDVMKRNRHKPI